MNNETLTRALEARKIPDHMHDGVRDYVLRHIPAGGFMSALFSNELLAFMRADEKNRACMEAWIYLMVWDLPSACWGSRQKVEAWLAEKGGCDAEEA